MALKSAPIWVCAKTPRSQLGVPDFGFRGNGVSFNFRCGFERVNKLCVLAQRATAPVQDESSSSSPGAEASNTIEEFQNNEPRALHKDLNYLPKPLSATDLSLSPDDGSRVRVAYRGIAGAYSEIAALTAYPKCETFPCIEFEEALKAVELYLVDKAVLPIENSVGGSNHRNYDLLLRHRLHIVGEVQLAVSHCLLGLPGVQKEELKRILSHPQVLDQCAETLRKLGVISVSTDDTAGAAKTVASNDARDTGAVASPRAALIYGLDILAEKIQDDEGNVTRFLVLSREPTMPGLDRPYKTSIVFSLERGSGSLFKALGIFSLRDINLLKIESRPQRNLPSRIVDDRNKGFARDFDYLFYVDFEASMAEPRAQYALANLQEFTKFIRVLGCYPIGKVL